VSDEPAGAAFPFGIDPRTGGMAVARGSAKLRGNLEHLVLTGVGERVMAREYGGGAGQMLQANINDGLLAVARHRITAAVIRYEPRVLPQEIDVAGRDAELLIRIEYVEAGDPSPRTTVVAVR
jgi:phage baseplate assembly protein W